MLYECQFYRAPKTNATLLETDDGKWAAVDLPSLARESAYFRSLPPLRRTRHPRIRRYPQLPRPRARSRTIFSG